MFLGPITAAAAYTAMLVEYGLVRKPRFSHQEGSREVFKKLLVCQICAVDYKQIGRG